MQEKYYSKSWLLSAFVVFLGAFLLFQIQPLMVKVILPWFGGGSSVWITSMLFFQVALLAGYAYAYVGTSYLSLKTQFIIHFAILLLCAAFFPITIAESWVAQNNDQPALKILVLLMSVIGLPYFILSSTSPLLQKWVGHLKKHSPYKLYALSNIGSLLALFSYPIVFEPRLALSKQLTMWSTVFWIFALGTTALMLILFVRMHGEAKRVVSEGDLGGYDGEAPSLRNKLLWFLLPLLSTSFLLSLTDRLTQDVAPVPLLWILPLGVYLFSFALTFSGEKWYLQRIVVNVFLVLLPAIIILSGSSHSYIVQVPFYLLVLFAGCLFCHGELYRLRPSGTYLVSFYMAIASGGALGGIFVGLVSPLIFNSHFEFYISVVGIVAILFTCFGYTKELRLQLVEFGRTQSRILMSIYSAFIVLVFITAVSGPTTLHTTRNFYGTMRVAEYSSEDMSTRINVLYHGTTLHGSQIISDERRKIPTTYYWEKSPIGAVFKSLSHKKLNVGAVGLGVGTIAAYGKDGDSFRFYEINPEVEKIANSYFTYLRDTPADVSVVLGDARLSLEKEASHNFDILILDAFSGDAIPMHLLTEEAMKIYERHLAEDGLIAFHISNRYLDLEPPVAGLAERFGMRAVLADFRGKDDEKNAQPSTWVIVGRGRTVFTVKPPMSLGARLAISNPDISVWTDDYGSLWGSLRGVSPLLPF